MSASTEVSTRPLRLVGVVDERPRSFPLRRGRQLLGSAADCALRFEHAGVSRHHAAIEDDGECVTLVDLESKNGTWVNGRAVEHGEPVVLDVGDEIDLCGLLLRVEPLDPADADLALALTGAAAASVDCGETTTNARAVAAAGSSSAAALVEAVGQIWRHLFAADGARLDEALACAAAATCAASLVALERPAADRGAGGGDDAIHLASHGSPDAARLDALRHDDRASETAGAEGSGAIPGTLTARCDAADGRQILVAAFDGHPGPGAAALLELLAQWLAHVRATRPAAPHADPDRARLVFPAGFVRGTSAPMRAVYGQLLQLTQGDVPVLIVGDTGVGKELVARTLHLSSQRARRPLVAINCAAIPSELLEAELFGIDRGVATGVSARQGRIAAADGGTLFLDEIGDMPAPLQAKLLRVLQEGEVQPVGGAPRPVDVRIVSATHAGLEHAIEHGAFRRDLYYRLAGFVLRLPTLAERRDDLPMLVEHFLRRVDSELGKGVRGVTVGALQRLAAYSWPGNIRQLEHEVRRLVYLAHPGQAIDSSLLSPEILAATGDGSEAEPLPTIQPLPADERPAGELSAEQLSADQLSAERADAAPGAGLPTLDLHELERQAVEAALAASDGTLIDAARRLGLSRDALRRRLVRHGLRDD